MSAQELDRPRDRRVGASAVPQAERRRELPLQRLSMAHPLLRGSLRPWLQPQAVADHMMPHRPKEGEVMLRTTCTPNSRPFCLRRPDQIRRSSLRKRPHPARASSSQRSRLLGSSRWCVLLPSHSCPLSGQDRPPILSHNHRHLSDLDLLQGRRLALVRPPTIGHPRSPIGPYFVPAILPVLVRRSPSRTGLSHLHPPARTSVSRPCPRRDPQRVVMDENGRQVSSRPGHASPRVIPARVPRTRSTPLSVMSTRMPLTWLRRRRTDHCGGEDTGSGVLARRRYTTLGRRFSGLCYRVKTYLRIYGSPSLLDTSNPIPNLVYPRNRARRTSGMKRFRGRSRLSRAAVAPRPPSQAVHHVASR